MGIFKCIHINQENLHGELEHFKHRQTILIQIKLVHIIVSSVVKKQGLT